MVILQSFIDKFTELFGFKNLSADKQFEHFVNYSVASNCLKKMTIPVDLLDDIHVGEGGDWGMDGILILINGKPITSALQAREVLANFPEFTVKIYLAQAKGQTNIDSGDLLKSLEGVENLLRYATGAAGDYPPCNDAVAEYREILRLIYTNSANFANGSYPFIRLNYAYKGEYMASADITSLIAKYQKRILNYGCLSGFECRVLDRREIVALYRSGQEKNIVKITFDNKIPLPVVAEIDSGYLCMIPMAEFRKLIIDDSGNFREEVFYDNVRAFQGNNSVNSAIDETIKRGDISLFTSMNNGITIIAKEVGTVMNDMTIQDYQIVNGCQTCHVIFNNIKHPDIDKLQLCVKIIASKNKDIRDRIIIANNSQTAVVREQLLSLLEEQRRIEDYYNAQNRYVKLYYERRSKQYQLDPSIKQWQIVNISTQITSFIAMILGKPGKIRGYYGQVLENFSQDGIKVFDSKTNPALYYLSAFAYVQMTHLFTIGVLPREFKKIKFHVLYAFRLMSEKFKLKSFSDKKADEYCDHICRILNDPERCREAFTGVVRLIKGQALKRNPVNNDRHSDQLTADICTVVGQLANISKSNKRNEQ